MNLLDKLKENFSVFAENPAISDFTRTITYWEASESTNHLIRWFKEMNLRNQCIGIDISNRIDHVVAILAVILTDNYYVSVTDDNRRNLLDTDLSPVDYLLSSEQLTRINQRMEDFNPRNADHRFCAFLTSGTTGEPKMVIHSIYTVEEDTFRQIEENHITDKDKIDMAFSFAFSASLACIFPALLSGAELCIFDTKKQGVDQLPSFWEERGVTFTTLSVSTFRTLCVLNSSFRHLGNLRFVSIGAEPHSEKDIRNFHEKFPSHAILQVAYATTETRTISQFISGDEHGYSPYPSSLGLPVRNKTVKILSDEVEELPPYAIGEIVVESDYISADYHYNSGTENPIARRNGNQVSFFTGDLGYKNLEGYLFYSGRKYQEMKINGMKVNLGLIEQTIVNNFDVRQAVVVINSTVPSRNILAAFVYQEAPSVIDKIKSQILTFLPVKYLPMVYVPLLHFPVTHSGKIDKKKLESYPLLDYNTRNSVASSTLPENDLVESLILIWIRVLNVRQIVSSSNFFNDLGGDSLHALLCNRAMELEFKICLPVNTIYSYSTPEALAHFIGNFLGTDPVHIVQHNSYISGRKNMFIIGGTEKQFEILLNAYLSNTFNISFLNYDLIGSSSHVDGATKILERMIEIVSLEKEVVIVGYSFNGYIAHQLAGAIPQASCCVLLDTPNYFDYEPYRQRSLFKVVSSIFKTTFWEKDYLFPWFVLGGIVKSLKYKIMAAVPEQVIQEESKRFNDAINFYLSHLNQRSVSSNCLFIKATRAFGRNYNHGYNWKDHFSGLFKIFVIKGGHSDIFRSQQALEIADIIIKWTQQ